MHKQDAIYLDQLCPKISNKSWRESLHKLTKHKCIYCGKPSESLDHLHPMSKGGTSITSNCVPCCLTCNGNKSDSEVLSWYRKQIFYDPRRAMAIRAWFSNDLKLASVLLNYLNYPFTFIISSIDIIIRDIRIISFPNNWRIYNLPLGGFY